MPTATQLGGHRGQAGVQAVSCSGRAAALPRHLLCPTQVAAVPMPSCQGKWMLNKDPNLRVRTQKVLAQSCRVLFRQGQSPRAAPACLPGWGPAPGARCPSRRGSHGSPSEPCVPGGAEASCAGRAEQSQRESVWLRSEPKPGVAKRQALDLSFQKQIAL